MMKGGWSVGKSTVNPKEDADLLLASGQAINTGNYIIKLGFGTPAQISYSVLDTGSIIAWIPCNPCSSAQECQSLGLCENNSNDVNCSFGQIYGDQSEVDELLSSETLSVGSPPVEDFVFGCANAVSGLIQRLSVPGLVGFGRDPLSFVSQTDTLYDSTFSYCLPSLFSSAFTGSLLLGKGAISSTGLQFTPLLSNARYPYFYYVGLNGISVGEELVSIPEGTFTLDQATGRGIPHFDTRYNKPSGEVEFPLIMLHFDDSLDFTLPLDNILYPGNEDGSVLCLALSLPPGGRDAVFSIIGNYQQQNFRIVHDVTGSRLGIARENCDG
ncbi:hypothetical protein SUGI_0229350 [Cryptomeria japonica]|nr:hypothetical protein SUGI_0229350 [Cryptomeria japonica]